MFANPSFTALPPLTQNCLCLRGLYGWSKNRILRTRARVRYLLDRVLGKGGDFALRGLSAQRGSPRRRILPRGSPSKGDRTCAVGGDGLPVHLTARARNARLGLVACLGTHRGQGTRLAHVRL